MQDTDPTSCVQEGLRPVLILFLHGSGDSGPGFRHTLNTIMPLEQLVPRNSVLLFPTAPERPYTPLMRHPSRVWFDRPRLHYDAVEDSATMRESILALEQTLSDALTNPCVKDSLVFLVGFSMGGSMALHLGFHIARKGVSVHGVFVHSSYIGRHSNIIPDVTTIRALNQGSRFKEPPIFVVHGTNDTKVPCQWGRLTVERLRKSGYKVDFKEIEGLRHEISAESMRLLKNAICTSYSES